MFSNFFKRPSIYIFIFSHWIAVSSGMLGFDWLRPVTKFSIDKTVDLTSETTTTAIQSSTPTTTTTSSSTSFTSESPETTKNSNTESPMDKKSESTEALKTSTTTELSKTDEWPEDHDDNHGASNKEDESRQSSTTTVFSTTTPFTTTTVTTQPPTTTTTEPTPTTTPSSTTTTSTETSTTTISPTTEDPITSSANSKDKENSHSFRGAPNNDANSSTSTVDPSDSGKPDLNDSIATPTPLQSNESSKPVVTQEVNNKSNSSDSNLSPDEIASAYDISRDQRAIGKEDGTKSSETITTVSTSTMENVTIIVNTTTSLIPTTSQSIVAIESIARRVNTSSANSIGSFQFLSILLFSLLITQISL
ncbi:uncharacterized protein LOC128395229 [Panonychus citri]|uniref:uncharacterized protein LOC128395229 n=1 Tax=Panonychus citri TaxID=50023 RepID=UPI002306FAF7|nr:uncharacterized protein LOC128395229 [Panonychus citri]